DADAMFERAKLLERFRALEWRGLERGQNEEGTPVIRVNSDMTIERGPAAAWVARIRNWRAREIQREASPVQNDFHNVWVRQFGGGLNPSIEGRHRDRRIGKRRDHFADGSRVEQRLVTLD